MMEHIIVGAGNLGIDLATRLEAKIFSQSQGHNLPEELPLLVKFLQQRTRATIWVSLGAGSVPEAKRDYEYSLKLHYHIIRELVEAIPSSRFIAFSTDYVASEERPYDRYSKVEKPRSRYAESKLALETWACATKPTNLAIVRVGSLYGPHKPERCFPAKLKARNLLPTTVTLPSNRVTPTPTPWLAEVLALHQEKLFGDGWPIHHASPMGSASVAEWGREILGPGYEVLEGAIDQERPPFSHLGCSFVDTIPTWSELWKQHGNI